MALRSFLAASLLVSSAIFANPLGRDLVNAPPTFTSSGKQLVAVDFQTESLKLTFDVAAKKGIAKARIEFYAKDAGYPMLDLVPKPSAVSLDGASLGATGMPEVTPPGGATKFRYINKKVDADTKHVLVVDYEFPAAEVTFTANGASAGFFMSDVGEDRNFLESYAPANFEFDHFALTVDMEVRGATKEHQLFTNGDAASTGENAWHIVFPNHFTTSSIYLHLTEKTMQVRQEDWAGKTKQIPITVYASSSSDADKGLTETKEVLTELEGTYGPFAHDKVVVYISSIGGGMEYCGATITTLWALGHELTHSYFARGYMPANGNSGWMDEAIASWRDNDYPKGSTPNGVMPVNLAAFSPYRRTTPSAAYTSGAELISDLDFLFSGSGMKVLLRQWFDDMKYEVATTDNFHRYLERVGGKNLQPVFDKYVYGKGGISEPLRFGLAMPEAPIPSHHPRMFTKAELAALR